MAKLTAAARKKIPTAEFAEPGERKYPIMDRSHAANALSRVAQHGDASEKKKVSAAVHRKFPDIGKKSTKKASGKRLGKA